MIIKLNNQNTDVRKAFQPPNIGYINGDTILLPLITNCLSINPRKSSLGSVFNFVSLTLYLIPDVGCEQSPQILINTEYLSIFPFEEQQDIKSLKTQNYLQSQKIYITSINYTLIYLSIFSFVKKRK